MVINLGLRKTEVYQAMLAAIVNHFTSLSNRYNDYTGPKSYSLLNYE